MWMRLFYNRRGNSETMVTYARNNDDIKKLMDDLGAEYERYEAL
ncbi:hypothetical protein EauM23_00007 [Exiguobacterium phage vB_EauM-23]|nr:hypothetical protein EauM23_00007 [Exiguobacterium phage vB_EauM-23]